MGYLKVLSNYPPYVLMKDKRGFISKLYGGTHTGIDSVCNAWVNPVVCAILNGTVREVYCDPTLGNVVKYGYGGVEIAYYHLKKVYVKVGQAVVAGKTKIGNEGSSGSASTGKHLHISIWINGVLVDPLPYLTGQKTFPADTATDDKGGDDLMICKTTVNLNLRKSAPSGDVIITVPSGTLLICGKTKTISGKTWAQAVAEVKGKTYAGWCCITGYTAEV